MRGFSFRAVAERLGGSTTLITHLYPSQRELLDDFAHRLVNSWAEELDELEADEEDAHVRLRVLLEWLIPLDEDGLVKERARINMLADQLLGAEHREIFDAWEDRIRSFLRAHVRELVPKGQIEPTVDLLRAMTNGVTLSAVEHPDTWTRERQLALIDRLTAALDLTPKASRRPTRREKTVRTSSARSAAKAPSAKTRKP